LGAPSRRGPANPNQNRSGVVRWRQMAAVRFTVSWCIGHWLVALPNRRSYNPAGRTGAARPALPMFRKNGQLTPKTGRFAASLRTEIAISQSQRNHTHAGEPGPGRPASGRRR